MCWTFLALGSTMTAVGVGLLVAFFVGRSKSAIERTAPGRVVWMITGALLASIGPLLLFLGIGTLVCVELGWVH